jgi:hypothetical protein
MHLTTVLALGASLACTATAHPHHDVPVAELARRANLSKRCASQVASLNRKRWAKRQAGAAELAARASSSNSTTTFSITTEAPYYSVLQNETCILTEEVTTGPYIWPRSQTLRQDITEGETGVPLLLDIGVMDVETCEPMSDVLVDIWHCNATGSYSSFTGLSPEIPFEQLLTLLNKTIGDDLHTDDTTFLRGLVRFPLSPLYPRACACSTYDNAAD